MVHALQEIRRTLLPSGLLIDLRPLLKRWPVEVVWSGGYQKVGRLTDLPEGLADDAAANRAMDEVAHNGWFSLERAERFPLFYSWDTASEMEQFMREEWEDFIQIDDEVVRAAKSAWAVANADARVRVQASMIANLWKKQDHI